ncbi:hypothetical protein D3C85_1470150 [compost metagenome]
MAVLAWLTSTVTSREVSASRLMPTEALITSSWPSTRSGTRNLSSKRLATRTRLDRLL